MAGFDDAVKATVAYGQDTDNPVLALAVMREVLDEYVAHRQFERATVVAYGLAALVGRVMEAFDEDTWDDFLRDQAEARAQHERDEAEDADEDVSDQAIGYEAVIGVLTRLNQARYEADPRPAEVKAKDGYLMAFARMNGQIMVLFVGCPEGVDRARALLHDGWHLICTVRTPDVPSCLRLAHRTGLVALHLAQSKAGDHTT